MEVLIKILQLILSLSLLVFFHELGHYLTARWFGIRVEKFYLFFDAGGFSLLKFRIGETTFGIGWVPFGGYCKISGMIDESMDTEAMKSPPQPWEFRSKPAWQRLIVMVSGVAMNVLTACLIYVAMSFHWGDTYIDNGDLRWGYYFNELAEEIGFQDGDRIVSFDGEPVSGSFGRVYPDMMIGRVRVVEVLRDDRPAEVVIPREYISHMLESENFMLPRVPFSADSLVLASGASPLDFLPEYQAAIAEHLPVRSHRYSLWEAIGAGFRRTGAEIGSYWDQLALIISPDTKAYKQVGSFITIGSIFPGTWDWFRFWHVTGMLSIILAVMNLLPIPALDGGHVLFLLWEVITRRKPSDRFLEGAQMVGMILLLGLLVLAFWNDIYRFFIK